MEDTQCEGMMPFILDSESGFVYHRDGEQWLTTAEEVYHAYEEYVEELTYTLKKLMNMKAEIQRPPDPLGGIVRIERTQEELLVVLQKLREQHSEKMMNEGKKGAGLIEEARQRMSSYSDEERQNLEILRQELIGLVKDQGCSYHYATIEQIINDETKCPFPIGVIPDKMGINLCCVEGISWTKTADGQLDTIAIRFIPNENGDPRNTQQ